MIASSWGLTPGIVRSGVEQPLLTCSSNPVLREPSVQRFDHRPPALSHWVSTSELFDTLALLLRWTSALVLGLLDLAHRIPRGYGITSETNPQKESPSSPGARQGAPALLLRPAPHAGKRRLDFPDPNCLRQ